MSARAGDYKRWGAIFGAGDYADSRISEYIRQNVQNQVLVDIMNTRTKFIQYLSTLTNKSAAISNLVHSAAATFNDDAGYWESIDDSFINSINVPQAIYVDGSYPTTTASIDILGFNIRVAGGRESGNDILNKIKQGLISIDKQTPIDVVSHSMGFAYSLGVIEVLQQAGYKISWVYCIAPENPSAGYVPQNIDKIWQYGSDEVNHPSWAKDLIAPQKAINGIQQSQRVFIPASVYNSWQPHLLGCYYAHKVVNYSWIFERKESKNDPGYVHKR